MRSLMLLAAAAAVSGASPPPPQLQQFSEALQAHHFDKAAEVVDSLIEQRTPADGTPRQNPLLNALIGRIYLLARQDGPAATYFAHANSNDLPAEIRADTALDFARALELQGDRNGAAKAYADAAANALNDAQRRVAILGRARQQLVTDPTGARQTLLGIANGSNVPERWEARYLVSLANSLLGDVQSAENFAEQAWSDSAAAPPNHLAPLHVATLRAGLAAARHDPLAERAMLSATQGLSVGVSDNLSAQLPVCGDDGVQPSDFVILGIVTGPYDTRQLIPIAARRLAIVAPFYDHLAGHTLIRPAESTAPTGTVVTVACRTAVHPNYVAKVENGDPLLDWFVEHGLYPVATANQGDNETANAIAARIDALSSRFGKQSPLLIEPRLQLLMLLEGRARAGDQIPPGQLTDLRRDIAAGLRRAGAAEWLAQAMESRSEFEQTLATTSDPSEQMSSYEAIFRKQLSSAPFEIAHRFLTQMLANMQGDMPAPVARIIVAVDANKPSTFIGRERQAWSLTVAHAQQLLGQDKEARATIASAGLEKDLCASADTPPKLLEQHFSYNDYPAELIAGEQEGSVLFEFKVAQGGETRSPRIIFSLPSGLFDEASTKGIGTVRYTAPTKVGKPSTCRGQTQSLIWRLEKDSDVWVPTIGPRVPDNTT